MTEGERAAVRVRELLSLQKERDDLRAENARLIEDRDILEAKLSNAQAAHEETRRERDEARSEYVLLHDAVDHYQGHPSASSMAAFRKERERAERAEREADERRETGDALQIELNRQMARAERAEAERDEYANRLTDAPNIEGDLENAQTEIAELRRRMAREPGPGSRLPPMAEGAAAAQQRCGSHP